MLGINRHRPIRFVTGLWNHRSAHVVQILLAPGHQECNDVLKES